MRTVHRIENQEEEEEMTSENAVEAGGTQESDNDTDNWYLIPFPSPQRVYGRTLRHNQIFSDGWFAKFSYPWCSCGAPLQSVKFSHLVAKRQL